MIDFSISLPLLVTSSLAAPAGAFITAKVDLRVFMALMGAVILLAGLRMFFSPVGESEILSVSQRRKMLWGGILGLAIGFMGGLLESGKSEIVFAIGGADGLPKQVKARADHLLSLSAMTLPHRLARLLLAEQLYRALCILKGVPYQK